SVAVVVVQRVPPRVGDENIRKAIVIVIAYGNAVVEAEKFARNSGFDGDIFERAVAPIAKKAVVKGPVALLQLWQPRTVAKKNVHTPVVVVIQNPDTPTHRLREVLPAGEMVVGDVGEIGTRRDVREVRALRCGPHPDLPGEGDHNADESSSEHRNWTGQS